MKYTKLSLICCVGLLTVSNPLSQEAAADIVIKLKEGRDIAIKVDNDNIRAIQFTPNTGKANPRNTAKSSPRASIVKTAKGRIIHVGPNRKISRLDILARGVRDGDTIAIDPGTYMNNQVVLYANDLTIRGEGGRPHFKSTYPIRNGKAVFVIVGDNVTIDNVEISGAHVADTFGAAIRAQGNNLTVKNSYFHHNEFAIVSNNAMRESLTVLNSEFAHHKRENRYTHAIYMGLGQRLTVMGSYFHHTDEGHMIKSRAKRNIIAFNRISDEKTGNASYLIDLPECGDTYIVGNLLHKGRMASNKPAIAYGSEKCRHGGKLTVVNNTLVSDVRAGIFLRNSSDSTAIVRNNLVIDAASLVSGDREEEANLTGNKILIKNAATYDYTPLTTSRAIDGAAPLPADLPKILLPLQQYKHPMKLIARPKVGKLDIGAIEAPK